MPIEAATFLTDLNPSYPLGTDPKSEGDDHLRLNKQVLQNTFQNADKEISLSAEQFNKIIMSKKNYDNIDDPREDELREPNSVDENVEWNDKNIKYRTQGTRFEDGTYDPDGDVPVPKPEDYPNESNLFQINERLKLLENSGQFPVGSIYSASRTGSVINIEDFVNPSESIENGGLGYGNWIIVGGGYFITSQGRSEDINDVGYTVIGAANGGEYRTSVLPEHLPTHNHTYEIPVFENVAGPTTTNSTQGSKRGDTSLSVKESITFTGSYQYYYSYWADDMLGNYNPGVDDGIVDGTAETHEHRSPHYGICYWKRIG